jgi:hypothetical protein
LETDLPGFLALLKIKYWCVKWQQKPAALIESAEGRLLQILDSKFEEEQKRRRKRKDFEKGG